MICLTAAMLPRIRIEHDEANEKDRFDSVKAARAPLGEYVDFYNFCPLHPSAGGRTPEQAYLDHMPRQLAA